LYIFFSNNSRGELESQLAPDYTGIELGIGESLLIKAISESSGRNAAKVKADLKKEGDLGLVAMVIIITVIPPFGLLMPPV
jgi:hypothetical protein